MSVPTADISAEPLRAGPSSAGRPGWLGPAALLVVTALVAYLPAYSAGFIWDDPDYVVNNVQLRSLQGLWNIWFVPRSIPQYYPLTHTTFWIEYQLWGLWAPGYHTTNILLHAAGAVLLWRLLLRLGLGEGGALLGALVWSLHPVQVESVAWVTERKNTLSFVWYALAGMCLLRWGLPAGGGDERGGRGWVGWVVGAFGLYLLALATKTVTSSLPAAYLLMVYWKRGRVPWRDVAATVPFFVVGGAAGLYTSHLERTFVGASGPEWGYGFVERCLIAGRAVVFYLHTLAAPVKLSFIYPRWEVDAGVWWQWLFPAGAAGLLAVLFAMRGRWGRGPFVAYAFFVGTVFPALSFVNVYPHRYSFVADHFQHLASVGPLALLGVGLARFPRVVPGAVLTVLGGMTLIQCRVYRDPMTLWTDTLKHNPTSWMAHINLAMAHDEVARTTRSASERARNEKAAYDAMMQARRLGPKIPETHWNAGVAHSQREEFAQAAEAWGAALAIDADYAPALNSLGLLEFRRGDKARGRALVERAVALQPLFPQARAGLGEILAAAGEYEGAVQNYLVALSLDPGRVEWRFSLGRAFRMWAGAAPDRRMELLGYAAEHLAEALRLAPTRADIRLRLGETLVELGREDEGRVLIDRALRADPGLRGTTPSGEGTVRP